MHEDASEHSFVGSGDTSFEFLCRFFSAPLGRGHGDIGVKGCTWGFFLFLRSKLNFSSCQ